MGVSRWHAAREPVRDDTMVLRESLLEPERFGELFDRYAPVIHRYLARRVGGDAADDLLIETFLAAFAARNRFNPERGEVRPWLYGCAANILARHRREELRSFRPSMHALIDVPDGTEGDVIEHVIAHQTRDQLVQALLKLSHSEREVVLLCAWEGLSYEQVAEALDIPIGTVRSRLSRSRNKIAEQLARQTSEQGRES